MSWTDAYVGLPYADLGRDRHGVDCWGLPHLVYREELGIALPSYTADYACAEERAELDGLISAENVAPAWRVVDDARAFDLVLFRLGRFACHIGIVIDRNMMLHMAHGQQAKVESWHSPRWASRCVGVHRHVQLLDRGAP